MVDSRNFFDQPVHNMNNTYKIIRRICYWSRRWLHDWLFVRLLLFQGKLQLQEVDADPRAIQQINFIGNLERAEGATIFFIIEQAKETVFKFSQGTLKVL